MVARIPRSPRTLLECHADAADEEGGVGRGRLDPHEPALEVDGKTSYATLPEGLGLGVKFDLKKMAEVAKNTQRKFRWPRVKLSDGSVADYDAAAWGKRAS